jgi:predicted TPR repeat methyltransferase
MQSKPEHFGVKYAETFKEQSVVDVYQYRPPIPYEAFDILTSLVTAGNRAVLDVGCGSGDIARFLVRQVERVDAVDFSQNMIERGKRLPNGNAPSLNWIYGRVEEVALNPPYGLITAGSSIHWLDWDTIFGRFRTLLAPGAYLALVYRHALPMPWDSELRAIRRQYSTKRTHSVDAVQELRKRGLFEVRGHKETVPIPFIQPLEQFIAGQHSRSTYARTLMEPAQATEFDARLRILLTSYCPDGIVRMHVVGTVTWGIPGEAA